jgi:predicted metal-binding membrane protein
VWSAVAGTLKVLLTVAGILRVWSAVALIAGVVDFCLLHVLLLHASSSDALRRKRRRRSTLSSL